jgi:hypothetical protein
MMEVAVTNHAVDRYQKRVRGTEKIERETLREMIRELVSRSFESGLVVEHPGHPERRMVPFEAGGEKLVLALGPNTTTFPGRWAVIGVLYEREVGKTSTGAVIGDVVSEELKQRLAEEVTRTGPSRPRFLVRIPSTKETYEAADYNGLFDLLHRRRPDPSDVEVYERVVDEEMRQLYTAGHTGK